MLSEKLHPDYGSCGYRDLEPGQSIVSVREAQAARKYLQWRKKRGLDHLNLKIVGDTVTRLED